MKKYLPITRSFCLFAAVLIISAMALPVLAQAMPDFSGRWKQDNERCQPARSGNVTLRIEHHDPEVSVETSIAPGSPKARHALQKYTTDGKTSVSTGADGDEFHTSVLWKETSLVFSIEEHEDGRILLSKETWSLLENGSTLQRTRVRSDGAKQVLFYLLER